MNNNIEFGHAFLTMLLASFKPSIIKTLICRKKSQSKKCAALGFFFFQFSDKDADIVEEKELNTKSQNQFEESEKISPPTDLALKQQLLHSVSSRVTCQI